MQGGSITKRDGYIQIKALVYAIAHIQSLPRDRQEWGDMRDMCYILRAVQPATLIDTIVAVERHTGIVVNLFPDLDSVEGEERDTLKAEASAFKSPSGKG